MARRGSNIYKRKDGRYEGRVPVGYRDNGSIQYKSVYARTLAEVKGKMAQFYTITQEQKTSAKKLTFRAEAEQWLVSAKLRVKPSSYANYQNIVNKHLLPVLGGTLMVNLTSSGMDNFVLQKLNSGRLSHKGGLSAKSVRDIMTVFRSISVYTERGYGIKAVHFTMPKTEQKKIEVLNSEERSQLEQYLIKNKNRTNTAVLLCMFTGLRVGELCGLKWEDIDLENNMISVNRTVKRVNRSGCSEIIIGTPKSRSSVRTIPIPDFLKDVLIDYKGSGETYLITGMNKPTEPRTMQNRLKAILKACCVRRVNFHMLRHTYATVCVEHGFEPKTLSELLGHADASIALNRYVHSSMQLKRDYVRRLKLTA
ncbi:MAG: site-specific integrase [Ruminococcus flavefaciens]|nr:site-specific integrase [Ruminococcus flavefaciens]MCM1363346.1 site-specific integrase [Clostridiales bacterium]